MGRLVKLWKKAETNAEVSYFYGPSKDQAGVLVISKKTGEVKGKSIPGMDKKDSWFFYGMLAHSCAKRMHRDNDYPVEATRAT